MKFLLKHVVNVSWNKPKLVNRQRRGHPYAGEATVGVEGRAHSRSYRPPSRAVLTPHHISRPTTTSI